MNFSKQSALGAVMLLGGSVMLYTTVKPDSSEQAQQVEQSVDDKDVMLTVAGTEDLAVEPLTTDIKTETDFLEKKQQEREALVKEQEEKAKKFIEEQEKAADNAISKTREENEQFKEAKAKIDEKGVSRPQVANRTVEEEKADAEVKDVNATDKSVTSALGQGATTYHAASGEGLIKIAKDNNIPLEVLAEANDMYFLDGLMYGQKLLIPSAAQVAKLEASAKDNQGKRAAAIKVKRAKEAAKRRAEEAKLAEARLKEKAELEKSALHAKKKADEQEAKRKASEQRAAKKAEEKKAVERKRQQAAANKAAAKKKAEQQAKRKAVAKAKAAEKAKQKAAAKKKAVEAKQATKKTSTAKTSKAEDKAPRGTFGIQIALAGDQKNADIIAAKLRKAGYKTKTSQTDRGVRVMVGPVKGKPAALKLKDKINKDAKTGVKNAWVLYWR